MRTIEAVRRSGVAVGAECTIREAATVMKEEGVGAVVIVADDQLIGLVTDRDLVCRALARGLASDAPVDSVMSTPVVTIDADSDLQTAFAVFHANPLRRLAVVRAGRFVGLYSVDDLLTNIAAELNDLDRPVDAEALFRRHDNGTTAMP